MEDSVVPSDDWRADALPMPLPGKLFRGDFADTQNNACPHWYAEKSNWSLIAEGYKHAADNLVAKVIAREALADEMFYPICFSYRHYIELCLKEISLLGSRIKCGKRETPQGHNLVSLWQTALPILRGHVNGMREADLTTIGEQIHELHQIDSVSDGFRYPVTTKNLVALDGLQHVNLRHLRDAMAGISTVLQGAVTYLHEVVECDKSV